MNYSTQLIHYGLPITKDKNAAKVRLLNALNQFKLEVPAWILKMEGELKKEWDKENNKLGKAKTLAKSVTSVTSGTTLAGRSPIKSSGVNVTGRCSSVSHMA